MKRFVGYALGCVLLYLVTAVLNTHRYKQQVDELKRNERVLLNNLALYKANDSLNAAEIGELTLQLKDYERTHENDLKTIADLGIKKKNLEAVNTMLTETANKVQGKVVEVRYKIDTLRVDTAKCIKSRSKWLDIDLCVYPDGRYSGDVLTRDSILIAEEVKYKRFLGFLWRTNKVKERTVKVVSKNPDTQILGFEFVRIKK